MNEKEGILSNWKLIGIIFAAVVVVLIYNGISSSVDKTRTLGADNITGSNQTYHNISNATTDSSTKTSDIISGPSTLNNTSQDKFFKDSITQNYAVLYSDLDCISKAAKNENFNDTARCGKFLNDDSNRILKKINDYNVSSPIQAEIIVEFKKSLENYSIGGTNLDIGARNRNISQMGDASMQIHNGTVGIDKMMMMLNPPNNNINNSSGVLNSSGV